MQGRRSPVSFESSSPLQGCPAVTPAVASVPAQASCQAACSARGGAPSVCTAGSAGVGASPRGCRPRRLLIVQLELCFWASRGTRRWLRGGRSSRSLIRISGRLLAVLVAATVRSDVRQQRQTPPEPVETADPLRFHRDLP